MATTDDYLNLVTSEHREQPLFAAVVAALTQAFADTINLELGLPQEFDLDTAVGVQLDAIGLWIGRDRNVAVPLASVYFAWDSGDPVGWNAGSWQGPFDPSTGISVLPDDAYRTLLRAKIAANQWDGTLGAAYAAWQLTFQGGGQVVIIQDHQDMNMTIGFVGPALTAIQQALFTGNYLPLKPSGVHIRHYALPANDGPMFGWGAGPSGAPVGPLAPGHYLQYQGKPQIVSSARPSTATYTGSLGQVVAAAVDEPRFEYNPITLAVLGLLVEVASTNLLLRSADLTATWLMTDQTVSTPGTVAPDGTVAQLVTQGAAGTGVIAQSVNVTANATHTDSFWVKRSNNDWFYLSVREAAVQTNRYQAWFNLATGAIGTVRNDGTATGAAASIVAYPGGWFRVSITGAVNNAATALQVQAQQISADALNNRVSAAATFVWGAQLEPGALSSYIPTGAAQVTRAADVVSASNAVLGPLAAGTYAQYVARNVYAVQRNTTATYTDKNGVMQTAQPGQARFNYNPITLALQGLLVEAASTNLAAYSNDFTQAVWNVNADGLTITAAGLGPDGNAAQALTETAVLAYHRRGYSLAASVGVKRRLGVFVKANGRTKMRAWSFTTGDTTQQNFDLAAGTCSGSLNPTIVPWGAGWFRCSFDIPSTCETTVVFGPSDGTGFTAQYVGDGVSGILAGGAQLEVGNGTSLIPTNGAPVTRAADNAFVTADLRTLAGWGVGSWPTLI